MASRNFKVGTVYTRVLGLLKAGAVKEKPLWFDVVEAFPPIMPTMYNRAPIPGKPKKLHYWEDEVREKFYKEFKFIKPTNLFETDSEPTICDRFIKHYEQFTREEADSDVAFTKSKEALEQEGVNFMPLKVKERKPEVIPATGDSITKAEDSNTKAEDSTTKDEDPDIKEIFQL